MRYRLLPAVLLLSVCFQTTARAVPIPIINAGFEQPVLSDGNYTDRSVPGWIGSDANDVNNFGVYNPTADFSVPVPEGSNVAYIERGNISQGLTSVLMPGEYTLTLHVGNSVNDPPSPFLVSLIAGGDTIAQATSPSPADGLFGTVTLNYLATASDPNLGAVLRIVLEDSGFDKATESYFDDVRLDFTPVPEPSTIILMGAALSMGAIGRRTRSTTRTVD